MLKHIRRTSEPSAALLLLLLLSADLVFIVLHVIIGFYDPNPALCDISGICAYINVYHLIKLFWIVIVFIYVARITSCPHYASWALMFAFFTVDDALWMHQKIGDLVANTFYKQFPHFQYLDARFFELAVLASAGLVLLATVLWSYSRGAFTFKKITIDMLWFISALVFFGLVVDAAKAIKLGPAIVFGLGFVEDGGELVVDSLILWYVFLLAVHNGKPRLFLHDLWPKAKAG